MAKSRTTRGKRGIKVQIRRFYLICKYLSEGPTVTSVINDRVNAAMKAEFSQSTIEKDIRVLREELNCPIEMITTHGRHQLQISKEYSFLDTLSEWAKGNR